VLPEPAAVVGRVFLSRLSQFIHLEPPKRFSGSNHRETEYGMIDESSTYHAVPDCRSLSMLLIAVRAPQRRGGIHSAGKGKYCAYSRIICRAGNTAEARGDQAKVIDSIAEK